MSNAHTHTGIIRSLDGDAAVVAVAVQGCAGCSQKKDCGIGKLAGSGKTSLIRVTSPAGAKIGDSVSFAVDPQELNRSALFGYLVPAIFIVIGTVAGQTGFDSDAGGALGALGGLLAGLIASRFAPTAPLRLLPSSSSQ